MLKLYRALHKNTRDSSRDAEAERAQYGNALKELVHTALYISQYRPFRFYSWKLLKGAYYAHFQLHIFFLGLELIILYMLHCL